MIPSFKDLFEKKEETLVEKSVEQKGFEDQFSELINKLREFEKYSKEIDGSSDVLSLCNRFRNDLLKASSELAKNIQ